MATKVMVMIPWRSSRRSPHLSFRRSKLIDGIIALTSTNWGYLHDGDNNALCLTMENAVQVVLLIAGDDDNGVGRGRLGIVDPPIP